ncbi:PiggyBac transposable element-derived protein 3 [Trichinella papuae]|uniref:PiggyBac transposable element-derived protein 3 n=1 Tax=Trichinella papuae TaxID=268474 RepID=A0A0V1M2H7_9BILA|nr:PiggyBac transposable element-derived protein 3 [Trichinella papuae]KRZ66027.1 PiggyBac transposable element-derived protein 3 [Trichinella papuae]KRZ66052.1 PiggyBac transposable element-derived protein 3 [Trichinella papuae]
MVLAFVCQCGERCDSGCLADSLLHHSAHLEFRRQVVLSLLQSERTAPPRALSGLMSQLPDIRFDGANHILGTGPQGHCKVCRRNTKNMCKKCNIRFHAERGKQCFEIYHRQK